MDLYVFDIETNAARFGDPDWLDSIHTVHCICVLPPGSTRVLRFNDQGTGDGTIADGVKLLEGKLVVGHNAAGFDVPVLSNLHGLKVAPRGVRDTKVMSEIQYGDDLRWIDVAKERKLGKWIPPRLYGSHSLEAWGHRLGDYKDDYAKRMKKKGLDPWAAWSLEMEDYCEQDVYVTANLLTRFGALIEKPAAWIEPALSWILRRQESRGFAFDTAGAERLTRELAKERAALAEKLKAYFGCFYKHNGPRMGLKTVGRTAKFARKEYGYTEYRDEGVEYTSVKLTEFNPGSRQHIARMLQLRYKWKPKVFTPEGHPEVSEKTLRGLPYKPVPDLMRYLLLEKRLGQIAEGNEAWLKRVKKGRIHGRVNQNGARTGRMSHSKPNLAQTPRVGSPYGKECRALFVASPGYKLVGIDAEGLELRMLASDLARWDGGQFANAVVSGDKAAGTDAHSVNQKALGLNSRDYAKTWLYARMYGAQAFTLGQTVYDDLTPEQRKRAGRATKALLLQLGQRSMDNMAKNLPAFDRLVRGVQRSARQKGWLWGLDGRRFRKVTPHVALNTRLQGNGSLVMKLAAVLLDEKLQAAGLEPGDDYEFVANVHDEWQIECRPEHADYIGQAGCHAIRESGEFYELGCPLAGDYSTGGSWAETH